MIKRILHSWSFHMKFMKRAEYEMTTSVRSQFQLASARCLRIMLPATKCKHILFAAEKTTLSNMSAKFTRDMMRGFDFFAFC